VRTTSKHENIHEFLRHDDWWCPLPNEHLHLPMVALFWIGYFRVWRLTPYAFPYVIHRTDARWICSCGR
jgi:hypothetical protein